jgi:nicotinamide mononucleotide (NMN) deamidase PncC
MAMGALVETPEADWAASVTGHLGPAAPPDQDGLVFVGVANRDFTGQCVNVVTVREYRLIASERIARQREAACRVLELVIEELVQDKD